MSGAAPGTAPGAGKDSIAAAAASRPAGVADGLEPPERGRAMLVIILGIAVAVLDGSIMNLALPTIARELQAGAPQAIWVVNAYQIATLGMLLPLAALGERIGYRRVYLLGMGLFAVSSLGAMLASSLEVLIAARAVQGLGAAGIMSVNAALVRMIYPRARLGQGLALNSLVVAASSVAGPSVAAAILSVSSWPMLFAINLPLGVATLWLGRRALPFNPPPAQGAKAGARFSVLDVGLNMLMFALVFIGGDQLGVHGGSGGLPAGAALMLVAGLAVGAVYLRRQVRAERRGETPLFPVDLLRIPVFALSMGASVAAFCAQMLAFLALPFLLLEAHGRSHAEAGLLITPWPLAIVAVAPLAGRLIGRVADGLLGGIGMAMLALGLVALALLPQDAGAFGVVWRMALCGVGFALFQSPNNHTIVTSAPLHRSGAAGGMLSTARLTGQTLGAVLLAVIFAVQGTHGGHAEAVAFWLAAGSAAVAGVCSVLRLGPARAAGAGSGH
ncbi:MFS transporter [Paracidovorax cattleyae]|uniref:MFS transporter, DHA2 family, multidrug resistance protein n=1 Tax=Paracidovorax cattleyae TaxID=80868 RepID=A0A1H0RPR4_9BURK|nr:MFS transporter [Paracidovorax cattleyae]AVS76341.1 MFS transporter [Paracidovorax cattleyae]SDP31417.1 MFS transporter, DHA2 family, multidrug resistance protein [Paracidovorax cattleyae]